MFAPWAYGCTEPAMVADLVWLLGGTTAVWGIGCIAQRRWPKIHPVFFALTVCLLIYGWWMSINAHFQHDAASHRFSSVTPALIPHAPGGVDAVTSCRMMLRITTLLCAACFASDLVQSVAWRVRLWWTIGLAGTSVILFGLIEKALGANMIFFAPGRTGSAFFATYYYSGNAGAFINLVLPLIAGLVAISISEQNYWSGALWVSALVLCLAGAFVNVSRAGVAITVLLLPLLAITFWRGGKVPIVCSSLAAITLAVLIGWDENAQRKWLLLGSQFNSENPRLLASWACLRILPESGPWGFGPGTFEIVFPHYTSYLGNRIAGIWRYAHNDYLQTLIEWGWIGSVFWAAIFLGAIVASFQLARTRQYSSRSRTLLLSCGIALTGVALHAWVDFPLQIASLQLFAATYIGIAWGSLLPSRQYRGDAGSTGATTS